MAYPRPTIKQKGARSIPMKAKRKGISYAKYGYLFSIPFVVVYLIFSLYPAVYTIILAFTDCKGLGNTNWNFLVDDPFKNFNMVLTNKSFLTSVQNTVVIWIMNFIPQLSLSLLLTAWFTSPRCKIRGQGFFKVVFYMPNIITAATVALLFGSLFSYPVGPMNDILVSTGLLKEAHNFAIDKTFAKCLVAFIQFWMWYGNSTIVFISGVLGINPEIFEAAEIDGATGAQTFFRITLPNIKTIMLYSLVTSLIGGLNMYDIPKMLYNGGPDNATGTASVFIFNQAFAGSYLYNRASAASILMFVVIAICSGILFFVLRDKDEIAQRKLEKAAIKAWKKQNKEVA